MMLSYKTQTLERAEYLRDNAPQGYVGLDRGEYSVFVSFKTQREYDSWKALV